MTCEFRNCTVAFREIAKGVCFAFPSNPKELYLKTEEVWDEEGDLFNAIYLVNGMFTTIGNDVPILAYPMAKVII